MRKLIRNNLNNSVELIDSPLIVSPFLKEEDNVLVSIKHVGLCRTDLFVAEGSVQTPFDTITLGHEFSAIVKEDPKKLLNQGSWLGFNPLYKQKFMGLDFDGAICEEIWVPRDAIISVNQNSNLSSQMIAYLEPVAASAAPLKKLLKPSKVLVIGDNRIAKLTVLILNTSGHEAIMCSEKDLHSITSNSYEYVIETVLTEDVITHISRILIDNGTWLLKSRKKTLTSFTSMDFIAKEITISCINYLDFHKSLEWMESNYENLKDLLGNSYSLSNWSDAFKEARLSETKKIFIEIS